MVERSLSMREVAGSMPAFSKELIKQLLPRLNALISACFFLFFSLLINHYKHNMIVLWLYYYRVITVLPYMRRGLHQLPIRLMLPVSILHYWMTYFRQERVERQKQWDRKRDFPYGLAVRIPGFHPGGPGSTPGMGTPVLSIDQQGPLLKQDFLFFVLFSQIEKVNHILAYLTWNYVDRQTAVNF